MTVTLRNVSGSPRDVGGRVVVLVEDDALYEVRGDLADEQAPDAYLIRTGDDVRAWPHAHWADETPTPRKKKEL